MTSLRRTRRLGAAALGVSILGGATAATLRANPAAAAGIVSAVTTISCSVTGSNWCISGNDTSSGIGVIGTSKSGTGLRGTSTSQYGLKATSVTGTAILAQTTSGSTAITATATTGDGVSGTATGIGIGVYGTSAGYGVEGDSTGSGGYGTLGFASGSGTGVYGTSSSGIGVNGNSASGSGITGQSIGSGIGVRAIASTGPAVYATNGSGNANPAVYARNANGDAGDFGGSYIGVVGRAPSNGFPLIATDPSGDNNLFYVDGGGNVYYRGSLNHFIAPARGGATVKAYGPSLTAPTLEDTGTAQLVSGAAAVRLDPTFAASMDAASGYRVFVTPGGDTRGLYVATKTPSGFVVRESQGGRSTVPFDYRIVATVSGGSGQRMAVTTTRAPVAKSPAERAVPNFAPLRLPAPARPSQ
jgi:hypothetical protein